MIKRDLYPNYDVTHKRDGMSWNDASREVINARVNIENRPVFFSDVEWQALNAVCDRIIPQPSTRARVPVAAYIDQDLRDDHQPGFRNIDLPPQKHAWRLGLKAIDDEAEKRFGQVFSRLTEDLQDLLLSEIANGHTKAESWSALPAELFFSTHIMGDIIAAYYAHPTAWSEIGYGGPAGPRGYVRMHANERDPWEAASAETVGTVAAGKINRNVR